MEQNTNEKENIAVATAEDEWPEEESVRRPKKNKKKGGKDERPKVGVEEKPLETDANINENVDTTLLTTAVATAEDEWPEEESVRRPKKNKKKGGKEEHPRLEMEENPLETDVLVQENVPPPHHSTVATAEDEWPEETERKPKNKGNKGASKPPKAVPMEEEEGGGTLGDEERAAPKVLSKKEKEKLKKQRQKEAEKAQAAKLLENIPDSLEDGMNPNPSVPVPTSSKSRKNGGMTIALLQQMMAEQRAAEEAEQKRLEEEKRKEEEEARRLEEEAKMKEEERRLKKEREKARREQLKKEGKLLTKAQKEKELKNRQRLEHLLAAGVTVAGMSGDKEAVAEETEQKQKKVTSRQKKKPSPAAKDEATVKADLPVETQPTQPPSTQQPKRHEVPKQTKRPSEKPTKSTKPASQPQKKEVKIIPKVESMEDIKACWEDESESEKEKNVPKRPTKVKTAWDDSDEEEEEVEKEEEEEEDDDDDDDDEKTKRQEAIIAKASKQVKEIRDVSVERRSPQKSPILSPTEAIKPVEKTIPPPVESTKKQEKESINVKDAPKIVHSKKQPAPKKSSSDTQGDLRSPICCILGHVDTGKTKLLDKIRQTHVQDGEAGGITQQIGATYFPVDAIQQKIRALHQSLDIKVPGLLIIDTPGHESFTNLRSRGSSLCNMAILVVDIMHGLEPQTLESLNLLRQRKTPFIVALNKIDRMYDWKAIPDNSFVDSIEKQSRAVKNEFEERLNQIILAFAEQGLNARLYSKNENMGKFVSIVPTSAITGEGIPDMLYLLIHLTQTRMSEKIKYVGELEATVLEVKVVEGLGTTIDVILSNGVLNESDTIVVCGLEGPIVTHIRALLTPQPMRELRVKAQYIHHKHIKAAMGVKISANGLEKAVAGSRLLVLKEGEDEEALKEEVMADLQHLLASVDKSGKGVWVQASTLGSLEALLSFLKSSEIPVSGMQIGPVHKKDVMKASIMLEKAKEFAVMLCFDVKLDKDAVELAEEMGVKIFRADIIYHLFDQFTAYYKALLELRRQDALPEAVFPCVLKMVPGAMFNQRDPIVIGVDVVEGVLRIGTPICVVGEEKKVISLGKVTSIEQNHKPLELVKRGQASVAVKIECPPYEHPKMFGRHFNEKSEFYSLITRQSIDVLKENFKHEMQHDDWCLIIKLKGLFGIP